VGSFAGAVDVEFSAYDSVNTNVAVVVIVEVEVKVIVVSGLEVAVVGTYCVYRVLLFLVIHSKLLEEVVDALFRVMLHGALLLSSEVTWAKDLVEDVSFADAVVNEDPALGGSDEVDVAEGPLYVFQYLSICSSRKAGSGYALSDA
jgi:hypothetical protein